MELDLLTRDELIEEVHRLKLENKNLKIKNSDLWNNVKILIAKLVHEFKTPLNSIIGFGELISYKTDDKKIKEYIENILNCSEHLLSLVQNIIDVSVHENKTMKLSYSIFNSRETIKEIIDSFNEDIQYTLVDKNICADYTRFKQLVFNLISNSIKFKNGEKINIMTYVENNFFCFDITDYGEGIDKKDCERIFDLFIQVTPDSKKKQLGSGIGLALCKVITDAHKGNIGVKSKVGEGSTFTFKLPIDKGIT